MVRVFLQDLPVNAVKSSFFKGTKRKTIVNEEFLKETANETKKAYSKMINV